MDTSKEVVILSRDNEFALFLLSKGSPVADFGAITRVIIEIDGKTIDSDVAEITSSMIWWSESEEWRRGITKPVIKFRLGNLPSPYTLTQGIARGCKVITFDPDNPNGVEWTRDLVVEVKS
jgi:hypothetical protein